MGAGGGCFAFFDNLNLRGGGGVFASGAGKQDGYGIVRTVIVIACHAAGAGVVANGVLIAQLGAQAGKVWCGLGGCGEQAGEEKDGFLHDGVFGVGMFYRPSGTGCLVENRLRTVWVRNR